MNEREEFELWVDWFYMADTSRKDDGGYCFEPTNQMWRAWQARAEMDRGEGDD